jgi:hypothetical protein
MCAAPDQPIKPLSVDDIPDPKLPPAEPDDKYKTEQEQSLYKTRVRGLSQDIDERKKYAHRTFCLIAGWLVAVYALILLEGFEGTPGSHFSLDKTVLITVVGTTTASVLGIFIVVMHYLFPAKGQDEK